MDAQAIFQAFLKAWRHIFTTRSEDPFHSFPEYMDDVPISSHKSHFSQLTHHILTQKGFKLGILASKYTEKWTRIQILY